MIKKIIALTLTVIMLLSVMNMMTFADGEVEIVVPVNEEVLEYGAFSTIFGAPEGDKVYIFTDGDKIAEIVSNGNNEFSFENPLPVGEHTLTIASMGSGVYVKERKFRVEYNSAAGCDKGVKEMSYINAEGKRDYILNDELSEITDTLFVEFDSDILDVAKANVSVMCDGVKLKADCSKAEGGYLVIKFPAMLPAQGKMKIEIETGAYKIEKRLEIKAAETFMSKLCCEGDAGAIIVNDYLVGGSTITPSVSFINKSKESVEGALILTLYEGKKLVEIGTKNVLIEANADNQSVTLPEITLPEGENFFLEAYLIDAFSSRGILCDAVTLNPSNEAPYEKKERVYLNTFNHVEEGTYIVGTNEIQVNTDEARFYEKNGVKISLLHEGGNPADGTNLGQFVLGTDAKSIKYQTTVATSNSANSKMHIKIEPTESNFYGTVQFFEAVVTAVGSRSYINLYNNNEYLRTILSANSNGTWEKVMRIEIDTTAEATAGGDAAIIRYYENGSKIGEFKRASYSGDVTLMFAGYNTSNTVMKDMRFGQIK